MKKFYTLMIIGLIGALAAINSKADGIYIGGASKHFTSYPVDKTKGEDKRDSSTHPDFNDNQHFLAYQHGKYTVGYFENSFYQDTYFAARDFRMMTRGDVDFDFVAGMDYGYTECKHNNKGSGPRICPEAAIKLTYTGLGHVQPVMLWTGDVFSLIIKVEW